MRMNEVVYETGTPFTGYGPGFFRIGGERVEGGALVLPSGVSGWGGFEDRAAILAAAGEIDVLFVGTGAEIAHPPEEFRTDLEAAGIGLEVMASPSAARAYNVTLGEGRRVAAAVLPVVAAA